MTTIQFFPITFPTQPVTGIDIPTDAVILSATVDTNNKTQEKFIKVFYKTNDTSKNRYRKFRLIDTYQEFNEEDPIFIAMLYFTVNDLVDGDNKFDIHLFEVL